MTLKGLLCVAAWLAVLLMGQNLRGQELKDLEKKVSDFTLPNGLHFIVVERHGAAVVTVRTWVDVGSSEDPTGATGLAHMFERISYQGTETLGTIDWPAEKKALDAVEEAAERLRAERDKGARADQARIEALGQQLESAIAREQSFGRPATTSVLLNTNGVQGLGASAVYDHTEFVSSLPSNRMELWFLVESQRLLAPVFRNFYAERDAMLEEQKTRIENNVRGLMLQELRAAAFTSGPYHNPEMGWPGDIANLQMSDARSFFNKYYTASNMAIAVVGDVNPADVRRLAERYFGPLPLRPIPPHAHESDSLQHGPRRVQLDIATSPQVVWGFKRPDCQSPDEPVFMVLGGILAGGKNSLLNKQLVEEQRIAVEVSSEAAQPGNRYSSLFVVSVVPAKGHTVEEVEKSLETVLNRLASQRVDEESLVRARNSARSRQLSQLDTNAGISSALLYHYMMSGDWHKALTNSAETNKVTADDVQRVARRYLGASQRTAVVTAMPVLPPVAPARGGR